MDGKREEGQAEQRVNLWGRDFIFIALINFSVFINLNMTTAGIPVYTALLGAGDIVVGLVTTVFTGATLLVRPFSGLALDRFGRRGVLIAGVLAMVVITAAYALFPVAGMILAIRFVHGAAWGITSTATSTIAADLIPRQRFAEGMGYFALVSALAVSIAPALALAVLQSRGVLPMIMIAVGCTLIAAFTALFQRASQVKAAPKADRLRLADLFDKRAALPAALSFLVNCAFGAIITFIALHGAERGVENISPYFIVYAAATLVSRPITGKVIDRRGFFAPGLASALGVVITLALIAVSDNIFMFCLAGLFAGVGIGTGMGTLQTMAVAAAPPERRGVATSTFFFGFDAGIGAGAAVAGAMANAIGYGPMYLVMTVFPALALFIFIGLGQNRIAAYAGR